MHTQTPERVEPTGLHDHYVVTRSQVERYRRDGHVYLPGLLSAEEVATFRPALAEAVAEQHAKLSDEERALGGSSSHFAFNLGDATPAVRELLLSQRLARVAADLLGSEGVRILHYYGFYKAPGGAGTPWHQDSLFLPLDRDVVTLWLPLVDIPGQIAMTFYNESQKAGFVDLNPPGTEAGDPVRSDMERRGYTADEGQSMKAGDGDFHSGMIVHCAPANTTDSVREVFAVCYYPEGSRIVPDEEVLNYPMGQAGYYFRRELRNQYFPGVGDGEEAQGPTNPVVYRDPSPTPVPAAAPVLDTVYPISIAQIEGFREKGHTMVRSILMPDEVAYYGPAMADVVKRLDEERHAMERAVAGADQGWRFVNNLWRQDPVARELVLAQRFAHVAADLLGVDRLRLFRDQSYFKLPGGTNTAWHQDAFFMPLDSEQVITMWLALAPVTVEMAPMSFIDGTQGRGYVGTSLPDDGSMDAFEHAFVQHGFSVTNYGAMAAGDASFHSGWTLHSSRTNVSPYQREAMVIVYFADGARIGWPDVRPDAPPQEQFAERIRRNNLAESLPGRTVGDQAMSEMTPIVFAR